MCLWAAIFIQRTNSQFSLQYVQGHVGIVQLRKAIPPYCFKPSTLRSMWFFLRDTYLRATSLAATLYFERRIDNRLAEFILCAGLYPFVVVYLPQSSGF